MKTSYWSPANVSEPRRWQAGVFLSGINMSVSTFSAPLPGDMSKQLHKNVMNVQTRKQKTFKTDTISTNETIERISTANYEDETKKTPKNLNSIQQQWKYNEPAIYLIMRFIATFLHVKHPFVSNWLTKDRGHNTNFQRIVSGLLTCIYIFFNIRNIKKGDLLVTRLMTSTYKKSTTPISSLSFNLIDFINKAQ